MRTYLKIAAAVVVGLGLVVLGGTAWVVCRQGPGAGFWDSYKLAKVRFDDHGIPTIEGADWGTVAQAQGYVVASQRLWQMDLIRRTAGGRLAEWFGEVAFPHDEKVQKEDRLAVAQRAVDGLPADERLPCERYARGVNEYIADFSGRWGVEYALLRQAPEPWTCADTILVVLQMAETLSATSDIKAQQTAWRRNLSEAWQGFLFSSDHPWNHPYFDGPHQPAPPLPPAAEFLPRRPIDPVKDARAKSDDPLPVGSNNWAWRGKAGAFLANDPHLGYTVPQTWYALRLRLDKSDWAVGVALPGVPGIVLGMNPALAWAFTNTGEDVDDDLLETLSDDGSRYLDHQEGGAPVWRPVRRQTFLIKVKGEAEPRQVSALFTRRGPLGKRTYLGDGYYSRQWLPLKEGMLRVPSLGFMKARSLAEFNKAVDSMAAPSQNVLMMDAAGAFGYRMSGTGVQRRVTGRIPQPAAVGEWLGYEPASQRRRLMYGEEGGATRYLATANERLWVDPFGGNWHSDDRKERIMRFLGSRSDFKRTDMEQLQVDTESRFRKELLVWIADRAGAVEGPAAALATAWRAWDGSSRGDPRAFAQAGAAEGAITKVLLSRVQERFKNAADRDVPYRGNLRRAWLTEVLEAKAELGVAPFGVTSAELARFLLDRAVAQDKDLRPQPEANLWHGQHPFVGRVPVVGSLFAIGEHPQWGSSDVVLAEGPVFGPSMRLVWDLRQPWDSTWAFPVGESGHWGAAHYADFHRAWATGERFKVFDEAFEWEFPGRQRP